jgi:hypothetical protein
MFLLQSPRSTCFSDACYTLMLRASLFMAPAGHLLGSCGAWSLTDADAAKFGVTQPRLYGRRLGVVPFAHSHTHCSRNFNGPHASTVDLNEEGHACFLLNFSRRLLILCVIRPAC